VMCVIVGFASKLNLSQPNKIILTWI